MNIRIKGTSPRLDEMIIIQCLEQHENEQQHGTGVLMMLLDAYDRKITRDQFIAAASAAITCADNIGRHSMMSAVKTFLLQQRYDISPVDVETTLAQTQALLDRSTSDVLKLAKLLTQCPKDEDSIQ